MTYCRRTCTLLLPQFFPLFPEVNLETIARGTSGFTGADLANLINQAALHGSAAGVEAVTNNDLEYARYCQDDYNIVPERCSHKVISKNGPFLLSQANFQINVIVKGVLVYVKGVHLLEPTPYLPLP